MLWVEENQNNYIDEDGKILKLNIRNFDHNLITLYGKEANKIIPSLFQILQKNHQFYNRINEIFFEKDIGWKIKLKNNNCIFLPLDRIEKLMNIFENVYESDLYDEFTLFDLRVNGRVYMSNKKC